MLRFWLFSFLFLLLLLLLFCFFAFNFAKSYERRFSKLILKYQNKWRFSYSWCYFFLSGKHDHYMSFILSFFAFNIWEQTSKMQNAKYLSLKYLCQDKVTEVCELTKKIPKFFKIQYLLIFMQSWLTSEK